MRKIKSSLLLSAGILGLFSCTKESIHTNEKLGVGKLFQLPNHAPKIPFPEDNAYSYNRWKLGKKLFFDTRLSINNTISCASCHLQEKAFTGGLDKNPGVFNRPGKRNAPTLTNIAYHPKLLIEGSVPSIEMQILVPIQESHEFAHNIVVIVDSLSQDKEYQKLSKEAYNRPFDAYVLTRSIANFERSMLSFKSKYDLEKQGLASFTEVEKRGEELFFSDKTHCSQCHSGELFTNFSYENNGIHKEYTDDGRYHFTWDKNDKHKYKVPTLRNIAQTEPYMHDGSIKTLEEVIENYNQGGKGNYQQSELIKPLNLSKQDQMALVAFLNTLSDSNFLNNPVFKEE